MGKKYNDDVQVGGASGLGIDPESFVPGQYDKVMDALFRASAMGGFNNQLQIFLTGLDRYRQNILPENVEHSGLTFITRPKLNLTTPSLRQDRTFAPLENEDPTSIPFMIRCLLDTKLSTHNPKYKSLASKCPIFNQFSPFLTPLCNGLTSISGFPDPVIQTFTTEGGFHKEDQTFAIGAEGMRGTYDFTLNFKDVQFSPIASIFEYWLKWMELATEGRVIAYPEDIDAQRICYTVSIYRFTFDPSRTHVMHYAKATGCFPKSLPLGGILNVDDNSIPAPNAGKFSIPFTVNHVMYDDYLILVCFNQLMRRYCPGIDKLPNLTEKPYNNFYGLPYIETDENGIRVVFKDISSLISRPAASAPEVTQPKEEKSNVQKYFDNKPQFHRGF